MPHSIAHGATRRIPQASMNTARPPGAAAVHGEAFDLLPGAVAVGLAGDQFRTLLGSCVSVILTDPRRSIGAMCHIVHVGRPNTANARNTAYGAPAMTELFARVQQLGINPVLCQAYVFGGGNMFPNVFNEHHVGDANGRWVMDFLHARNMQVLDSNLGGNGHRKISWTVGPREPVVEFVVSQSGNQQ